MCFAASADASSACVLVSDSWPLATVPVTIDPATREPAAITAMLRIVPAMKNAVYALPAGPESYEDFQWIMREIVEAGGDAFVSESLLGDGLTDEAVRARFDAARNQEYREILADAKALLKAARLPAIKS